MSVITAGPIHAFYLFDVAEAIDLAALRRRFGDRARRRDAPGGQGAGPDAQSVPPAARRARRRGSSASRRSRIPSSRQVLRLRRHFAAALAAVRGPWPDLVKLAQDFTESEPLEARAPTCAPARDGRQRRDLAQRAARGDARRGLPRLRGPRARRAARRRGARSSGTASRSRRCSAASGRPLSRQERDEVLRHRLSYLADDLVVPAWNAAFIYDTEAGVGGDDSRSSSWRTRSCSSSGITTICSTRELGQIYAVLAAAAAARLDVRPPLHARRAAPPVAVHRRQRDHRQDGERREARRRSLRGAAVQPRRRPPRPGQAGRATSRRS